MQPVGDRSPVSAPPRAVTAPLTARRKRVRLYGIGIPAGIVHGVEADTGRSPGGGLLSSGAAIEPSACSPNSSRRDGVRILRQPSVLRVRDVRPLACTRKVSGTLS